jgi:hypothetical protein
VRLRAVIAHRCGCRRENRRRRSGLSGGEEKPRPLIWPGRLRSKHLVPIREIKSIPRMDDPMAGSCRWRGIFWAVDLGSVGRLPIPVGAAADLIRTIGFESDDSYPPIPLRAAQLQKEPWFIFESTHHLPSHKDSSK